MKKIGKFCAFLGMLSLFNACKDDDGRDDTVVEMSLLTGKNWYYNAWLGDYYGMNRNDLLEVLRFENGGALKTIDFGGRKESVTGTWEKEGNTLKLNYETGDTVEWNVQHSGSDYITTIVNQQGQRQYTTDLGYLENLTADAFLINEYTDGNRYQTRLGASVRGNVNLREVALITGDNEYVSLENHGYNWNEKNTGEVFEFDGTGREVRFYLKIGKAYQLKLKDSIYGQNLPKRLPDEMNLSVEGKSSVLHVNWRPYEGAVYYRVEVFPRNMDITKPYFVSRVQPKGTSLLEVKPTTAGDLNQLNDLVRGESYVVRLTAMLYEPGVDVINDEYSYANVQAVSYFTKSFVWE